MLHVDTAAALPPGSVYDAHSAPRVRWYTPRASRGMRQLQSLARFCLHAAADTDAVTDTGSGARAGPAAAGYRGLRNYSTAYAADAELLLVPLSREVLAPYAAQRSFHETARGTPRCALSELTEFGLNSATIPRQPHAANTFYTARSPSSSSSSGTPAPEERQDWRDTLGESSAFEIYCDGGGGASGAADRGAAETASHSAPPRPQHGAPSSTQKTHVEDTVAGPVEEDDYDWIPSEDSAEENKENSEYWQISKPHVEYRGAPSSPPPPSHPIPRAPRAPSLLPFAAPTPPTRAPLVGHPSLVPRSAIVQRPADGAYEFRLLPERGHHGGAGGGRAAQARIRALATRVARATGTRVYAFRDRMTRRRGLIIEGAARTAVEAAMRAVHAEYAHAVAAAASERSTQVVLDLRRFG